MTSPSPSDRRSASVPESSVERAGPDDDAVGRRVARDRDARRYVLYFGGLIAFYGVVLAIGRPTWGGGAEELSKVVVGLMFAPTVGAALACIFGPGIIRFGGWSWWLLAAFVPPAVILAVSAAAAGLGADVHLHGSNLAPVLVMLVPASVIHSLTAIGEEVGWRGFLWILFRRRMSFLVASAVMAVIWWAYHAPLVFAGMYGSVSGLPAFAVAIVGVVLFVGVLTERSRSMWPSVLTHGSWNAFVATRFAATAGVENEALTGNDALLGEFGWLAAATMLAIGVAVAWWHVRTPAPDEVATGAPTGYDAPVLARWFRRAPAGEVGPVGGDATAIV